MMVRTTTRSLTLILLSAAACGSAGCELVPGLLSGAPAPTPPTAANLSVTLEEAEGAIDGTPIAPNTVEITGTRLGDRLSFHVQSTQGDKTIEIIAPGGSGVHQNPYSDEGLPNGDGGVRPGGGAAGRIAACYDHHCDAADEFVFKNAQIADGRSVVVDGTWNDGDRVHLEMRYQEM